jgi:hypothetical protein
LHQRTVLVTSSLHHAFKVSLFVPHPHCNLEKSRSIQKNHCFWNPTP